MSVAGESSVNWSIQYLWYLWPYHQSMSVVQLHVSAASQSVSVDPLPVSAASQSVSVVPLPVSAASHSVSVDPLPVSAASPMICLGDLTEDLSLSSDCQSVSVASLSVGLCSQ